MKKYLFGILAITLAVGFSAFTTKKANKPFISVTKYVDASYITNQQIATLNPALLDDATAWDGGSFEYAEAGNYLGAIEFNIDDVNPENGGFDGDLSLQEAIDAVRDSYDNTVENDFDDYTLLVGAQGGSGGTMITIFKHNVSR